jgi:outer membrane receptor protein involved in Fe transport
MKRSLYLAPFLMLVVFFFCCDGLRLSAQERTSAGITGRVTDPSEAGVPDALVVVTNMGTNAQRQVATDESGNFSVPNLVPATYEIRVEKGGFQKAIVKSVELQIGQVSQQQIVLSVGEITQSIEVQSEAPLLQSESGTVGQVIDEKKIAELPLNGRNLVQLAALSAGVSLRQIQRFTQYGERQLYVTVDGGRDASTNYVIDGVYVRSLRFNNLSLQPSLDTVREFNVLRNSFSSEYGQGQSVVTAVTKSGTNELHGTAFEFLRNDKLDARNFFAAQKPSYRRNQFGFSAGGPIVKDKLFVFGGYEGLRVRQGRPYRAVVPNPILLTGDLSSISTAIIDPDPSSPTFGQPFPNNRIPASRFSRFARVLSPTIPAPNVSGANNFLTTRKFEDDWDNITVRTDYNLSTKQTLFVRYIWYDASQFLPAAFTSTIFPQSAQNVSVGHTYAISSSLINEVRVGYNRADNIWVPQSLDGKNWTELLGLRNLASLTDPIDLGRPGWTIAGYTGQGEVTPTQGAVENVYSLSDTVSKVLRKHTVAFGVQGQHRRFNHITEVPPRGSITFNGNFSGNAMADYLLGFCSTCQGAVGSSRSWYRSNTLGLFFNDEWRVTPRLTLTLGLRYEYLGWWREQRDQEANFDPVTGGVGFHKAPVDKLRQLPQSLQKFFNFNDNVYPAGIFEPDKNNIGPRIGIAFRPTENWVIRAGGGVYFDNQSLNELQFTRLIPPFYAIRTIVPDRSSPVLVDTLFPGFSESSQLPAPFAVDNDNANPYTMQWNFGIQRTFAKDYLLELAYTGSGSRKLPRRYNQNQPVPGTAPLIERLVYPQFDVNINTAINDSLSNFHAGSIRFEKRYSTGLYWLTNYQFAKSIDDNSGESDNTTAYRWNRRLNRGLSLYHRRHRGIVSYGYELPFGEGKRWLSQAGPASYVFGGWQLQGIFSLSAGQFFTVTGPGVCGCAAAQWMNTVKPGHGKLDERTPNRWFDRTAFAVPATGFNGNAGRLTTEGPGLRTFDFSLMKIFKISEQVKLQFRGEFFNLLNHANFGLPDTNISNATAGVISVADDARSIQFGLKLVW